MNLKQADGPKVTFIDAVMGSGKSTALIKYIKQNRDKKFMVVCYTLDEVDRYCKECQIAHTSDEKTTKTQDLISLVNNGQSVVITHNLFRNHFPRNISHLLKDYELIIDEVIYDIFQGKRISRRSSERLIQNGAIHIKEDGYIEVLNVKQLEASDDVYTSLSDFKILYHCKSNSYLSSLSPDLFTTFSKCMIATYMSKYSLMRYYFDIFGIAYNFMTVKNGNIVDFEDTQYSGNQFANLLLIDETERRNSIGNWMKLGYVGYGTCKPASGHKSDYWENLDKLIMYFNGFLCSLNANRNLCIWTCYDEQKRHISDQIIQGKSKTKQIFDGGNHISCSIKGTNSYSSKKYLGYLINRNLNPLIYDYLLKNGIDFARKHQDLNGEESAWALSEMIQWIWRSAIRNSEQVHVYIPAPEMREALKSWLVTAQHEN